MDFFEAHKAKMVDHFLWLESINPEYAVYALDRYRKNPDCPCPDILGAVKEEKRRRAQAGQPDCSKTTAGSSASGLPEGQEHGGKLTTSARKSSAGLPSGGR